MTSQRDIGPDDLVIFARGDEAQPVTRFNADDIDERWLPPCAAPPLSPEKPHD